MIVDDRYLITGSANINDRSMLGDRDTELCIKVEDRNHLSIPYLGMRRRSHASAADKSEIVVGKYVQKVQDGIVEQPSWAKGVFEKVGKHFVTRDAQGLDVDLKYQY